MAEKLKEKKTVILGIICTILIVCGLLFVWPTLCRYDKTEARLVKINRITGYTQVLERKSLGYDIWYEWKPAR